MSDRKNAVLGIQLRPLTAPTLSVTMFLLTYIHGLEAF